MKWDGEIGLFDFHEEADTIPFSLCRLENGGERRNYDSSKFGMNENINDDHNDNETNNTLDVIQIMDDIDDTVNGVCDIHRMSCVDFRKKLVQQFDILFHQKNIAWPRSTIK